MLSYCLLLVLAIHKLPGKAHVILFYFNASEAVVQRLLTGKTYRKASFGKFAFGKVVFLKLDAST